MHRMRTFKRCGRHFGQSHGANLALAHQFRKRAHALLDGHAFLPTMQIVKIDDLGLEASQTILASLFEGLRPAVDDAPRTCIGTHALDAALACQRKLPAKRREGAPHQFLVRAKTVQRRGVEMSHAKIARPHQNARRRLRRRRHAIGMTQIHAPKTDG